MGSVVIINNKPYKFNNFERELMSKRGINAGIVSKRVRGRWEFSEALDAPYGMHLKEYREMKQMEKVKQARLEREIARQRRKEAELRKKKPHLFNVPQKHPRGRYTCYLMENDIFVKVKK